jgi:hypothetical protein
MSLFDSVLELFSKDEEEETLDNYYRPYTEKRNIGEIKKTVEFDVNKLIENPEFLRVVEELFGTPHFMVKLALDGKDGLVIEIPVENLFRGKDSKDESFIKVSRVGMSFVTMRSESQQVKDDGTTIETKKKVEEIQYDFKGLPNNYPKEVDGDTFSLFVPYAKMAYFVEVLISDSIININSMKVVTSEPLECKSYNFSKNKEDK